MLTMITECMEQVLRAENPDIQMIVAAMNFSTSLRKTCGTCSLAVSP